MRPTKSKLTALALAVLVAIGTGGVVATSGVSPGTTDEHRTTTDPASTITVDGYEFAVTDEDDWFVDDRADDRETVASLIAADAEAGEKLDALFDEGDRLRMDVYGSLQTDADSAHVRIHPDEAAENGDARPLLEVTVDLDAETVAVVGTSTDRAETDERLDAERSDEFDVTTSAGGDGIVEVEPSANVTFRTADAVTSIDVPPENVSTDGEVVRIDLPAESPDQRTVAVGDWIEIVDENGELTGADLETVRAFLANDSDATETLSERFDGADAVTLSVHGVGPAGEVQLDATAPGDNPETAVAVDLHDGTVSVDAVELAAAEATADLDGVNYTVEESTNE